MLCLTDSKASKQPLMKRRSAPHQEIVISEKTSSISMQCAAHGSPGYFAGTGNNPVREKRKC